MSIKSKAKTIWKQETAKYIKNISNSTLEYHAISHVMYEEIFVRNIAKTLEEAQKLENEVIILNTTHDLRVARINQLEKQIAEANKILDEFDRLDIQNFEHQQRNQRLREALK
jgi:vacuolar-type H+-ATPase subunit I/STV1